MHLVIVRRRLGDIGLMTGSIVAFLCDSLRADAAQRRQQSLHRETRTSHCLKKRSHLRKILWT